MGIGRNWDRAPFIYGASGPTPPLDIVSGAVAAYSFRKLKSTFGGTPDATPSLWADQSGNANNAVQAVPGNQPIVGTVAGFPGIQGTDLGAQFLAAPDSASDQDIFLSGGFAIGVVNALLASNVSSLWSKGQWVLYGFPGGGGMQLWWYRKGTIGDGFWGTNDLLPTGKHIVSISFNDTTLAAPVISIDGTVCTFGTASGVSGLASSDHGFSLELINNVVINSNDHALDGTMYEAIFFKGPVSAPNQAILLADMKSYYGIP